MRYYHPTPYLNRYGQPTAYRNYPRPYRYYRFSGQTIDTTTGCLALTIPLSFGGSAVLALILIGKWLGLGALFTPTNLPVIMTVIVALFFVWLIRQIIITRPGR